MSYAGTLIGPLVQAKFNKPPRDGPTQESGDEESGKCYGRHNHEDPALNAPHFRYATRQLSAGLLINAVDQYGSLSFDWVQFAAHPSMNDGPVARFRKFENRLEL